MEEDCRIRGLICLLDISTTGGTSTIGRSDTRKRAAIRLLEMLRANDASRREFVSARGVDILFNIIEEVDTRDIRLSALQCLTELVKGGQSRKVVQHNATSILFNFINRAFFEEKSVHNNLSAVKCALFLLAALRPKDRSFCARCRNSEGISTLIRIIHEQTKVQSAALNVLQLVASNSSCSKEIVPFISFLLQRCSVPSGRKNTGQVRTTLQIITKAVQATKQNCIRASYSIPNLVELIVAWHRHDIKHGSRLVLIRKSLISLLTSLANSKSGRSVLGEMSQMKKLFEVGAELIEKRAPYELVKAHVAVMHRCLPIIGAKKSLSSERNHLHFSTSNSKNNENIENDSTLEKNSEKLEIDNNQTNNQSSSINPREKIYNSEQNANNTISYEKLENDNENDKSGCKNPINSGSIYSGFGEDLGGSATGNDGHQHSFTSANYGSNDVVPIQVQYPNLTYYQCFFDELKIENPTIVNLNHTKSRDDHDGKTPRDHDNCESRDNDEVIGADNAKTISNADDDLESDVIGEVIGPFPSSGRVPKNSEISLETISDNNDVIGITMTRKMTKENSIPKVKKSVSNNESSVSHVTNHPNENDSPKLEKNICPQSTPITLTNQKGSSSDTGHSSGYGGCVGGNVGGNFMSCSSRVVMRSKKRATGANRENNKLPKISTRKKSSLNITSVVPGVVPGGGVISVDRCGVTPGNENSNNNKNAVVSRSIISTNQGAVFSQRNVSLPSLILTKQQRRHNQFSGRNVRERFLPRVKFSRSQSFDSIEPSSGGAISRRDGRVNLPQSKNNEKSTNKNSPTISGASRPSVETLHSSSSPSINVSTTTGSSSAQSESSRGRGCSLSGGGGCSVSASVPGGSINRSITNRTDSTISSVSAISSFVTCENGQTTSGLCVGVTDPDTVIWSNSCIQKLTANSIKLQEDIGEIAKRTKRIQILMDGSIGPTQNHAPCCEKYGQNAISTEPMTKTKLERRQSRLFEHIERIVHPDHFLNKLVYSRRSDKREAAILSKNGVLPVGQLWFESRFESGNLSRVIHARQRDYDLFLDSDLYDEGHRQWFFFKMGNMIPDVIYRFNVLNCDKHDSQFGKGMQPLMYSMKETLEGNPAWRRVGSNIVYFKNNYRNSKTGRLHCTLSFEIKFRHGQDTVFLAYHYPYTYSRLTAELDELSSQLKDPPQSTDTVSSPSTPIESSSIETIDAGATSQPPEPASSTKYTSSENNSSPDTHGTSHLPLKAAIQFTPKFVFNRQQLATTLLGNRVELLTITANDTPESPICSRDFVVISSRVHPGETNSSWVMRGIINHLVADNNEADLIRKQFIFKLVPMLNPDGVVIGNHRTNTGRVDLNRQWETPDNDIAPSIRALKGVLSHMVHQQGKPPFCYVDLHGHSQQQNAFLFGCDTTPEVTSLPRVMSALPMFSFQNCSFQLTRERCARVVVFRRLNIRRSYTLESTYNGCDQGSLRGFQINEIELANLGVGLLASIYSLRVQISNAENAENGSSCPQPQSNGEQQNAKGRGPQKSSGYNMSRSFSGDSSTVAKGHDVAVGDRSNDQQYDLNGNPIRSDDSTSEGGNSEYD